MAEQLRLEKLIFWLPVLIGERQILVLEEDLKDGKLARKIMKQEASIAGLRAQLDKARDEEQHEVSAGVEA